MSEFALYLVDQGKRMLWLHRNTNTMLEKHKWSENKLVQKLRGCKAVKRRKKNKHKRKHTSCVKFESMVM